MPRRYSFDAAMDDQAPLDLSPRRQQRQYERQQRLQAQQQQQPQQQPPPHPYEFEPEFAPDEPAYYDDDDDDAPYTQPAAAAAARTHRGPAFHPDTAYDRLATDRRRSFGPAYTEEAYEEAYDDAYDAPPPPRPPQHAQAYDARHDDRHDDRRAYAADAHPQHTYYAPPAYAMEPIAAPAALPGGTPTPGADNFGEAAAGGLPGLAYGVAERNPRASGVEALRAMEGGDRDRGSRSRRASTSASRRASAYQNVPFAVDDPAVVSDHVVSDHDSASASSLQRLSRAGFAPGQATPHARTPSHSPHDAHPCRPHLLVPAPHDAEALGYVDPNAIADDGDDGLEYGRSSRRAGAAGGARASLLSLGGYSSRNASGVVGGGVAAGAAAGAAAAGVGAAAAHRDAFGLDGEQQWSAAAGPNRAAHGGYYNAVGSGDGGYGKSEWLAQEDRTKKRWRWAIVAAVVAAAIAAIVCGVVFGVVLKNKGGSSSKSGSGSGSGSGSDDDSSDMDLNSAAIKKLLNNKNLHKVFPGVDYTPLNTQYPDCLTNPPSQNNITQDVAVLSQLTNTIRLYGTDCNQTQMTLHALRQLKLDDSVKIWLGVWQDGNATTNARQLAQMWDILDAEGADPFAGLIVANEILFREQMTVTQLASLLQDVRTNLTARGMGALPVATSDLGDMWDASLAAASDYVMANIHPFFSGVNANDAAAWTWSFWENNNGAVFKANASRNVISETGWPSQGGTDCGTGSTATSCPDASVAGITQMNRFMADWVCSALANGTQYFWFEAFDEPWKIQFDSGDQNWEDHWGLLDVDRNLKAGVTIPDCGGKTV